MEIKSITCDEALLIRHQVLWPDKDIEFCKVKDDDKASHFGVYIGNQLASVASIYFDNGSARLRKFATLENFQGQGLGSQLLSHVMQKAKQLEASYFWCDARQSAVSFYERFGMQVDGDVFMKSDIPYLKMATHL